jgi:hypothetical protein
MNFEIYFTDLNPEAQARYLAATGYSSPDDLNHEISPLAILDIEKEE